MSDAFNNKHNDALQLAFSRSLKNLEDASSGPVDPSILAILGDSVSADVPEELWSAEAVDKIENAIRSGDATVTAEALTLYLGKYLVEQDGCTWGVMNASPGGWPSTRIWFGVYNDRRSAFTPVYSWARHVVDGDDWAPLSLLVQ